MTKISINGIENNSFSTLAESPDKVDLSKFVLEDVKYNVLGTNSIIKIYEVDESECTSSSPCTDNDNCNNCSAKITTELKATFDKTSNDTTITLTGVSQTNIPSFSTSGKPVKIIAEIENYLGVKTICKESYDIDTLPSTLTFTSTIGYCSITLLATDSYTFTNFPDTIIDNNYLNVDTWNLYPEGTDAGPTYSAVTKGKRKFLLGVTSDISHIINEDTNNTVIQQGQPVITDINDDKTSIADYTLLIPEKPWQYLNFDGRKPVLIDSKSVPNNHIKFDIFNTADLQEHMYKSRSLTVSGTVTDIDVSFSSNLSDETKLSSWFTANWVKDLRMSVFLLGSFNRNDGLEHTYNFIAPPLIVNTDKTVNYVPLASHNQYKNIKLSDYGVTGTITHFGGLYMGSVVIKHKSINNGEGIILFKNNWFSDNSHAEYYDNGYKYWLYYQQYSSETKKGGNWYLREKILSTPPDKDNKVSPVYDYKNLFYSSWTLCPFVPYDPYDFVTDQPGTKGITWKDSNTNNEDTTLQIICPIQLDFDTVS